MMMKMMMMIHSEDGKNDENDDIASSGATISQQDRSGFQGGAQIQQILLWQIINQHDFHVDDYDYIFQLKLDIATYMIIYDYFE